MMRRQTRIDLLTVLIHEMGNVLGISHRSDNDVMTLRINTGERRLPSTLDSQYLNWVSTGVSQPSSSDTMHPALICPKAASLPQTCYTGWIDKQTADAANGKPAPEI